MYVLINFPYQKQKAGDTEFDMGKKLPEGWSRQETVRKKGKRAGNIDIYVTTPEGTVLRSKKSLEAYLKDRNLSHDIDVFNFTSKTSTSEINEDTFINNLGLNSTVGGEGIFEFELMPLDSNTERFDSPISPTNEIFQGSSFGGSINSEDCDNNEYSNLSDFNKSYHLPPHNDSANPGLKDVEERIRQFTEEKKEDCDLSLSLAAEAGCRLLNENDDMKKEIEFLKQELHNAKRSKSEYQLKLEDELSILERRLYDLNCEYSSSNEEATSAIKILEDKIRDGSNMKETLMLQIDKDRSKLTNQIDDLFKQKSCLEARIRGLEKEITLANKQMDPAAKVSQLMSQTLFVN